MTEEMRKLVDTVKAHAEANYEKGGWDYVVETYTDDELAEEIGAATTPGGAIKKVGKVMRLLDERRRDIESTAR